MIFIFVQEIFMILILLGIAFNKYIKQDVTVNIIEMVKQDGVLCHYKYYVDINNLIIKRNNKFKM